MGNGPIGVTSGGDFIYAANFDDDTVSVIRASDNTVVDTVDVGDGPQGISITQGGNFVYVANTGDDTVFVIRVSDNTVVNTISVGNGPVAFGRFTTRGGFIPPINIDSSCSLAAAASPVTSIPLYLFIPALLLVRRLWRRI